MRHFACASILILSIALFVTLPLIQSDWTTTSDLRANSDIDTIVVFRMYSLFHCLAFFTAVGLSLTGLISIKVKRIPFRYAFLFVPVLCYPPCFVVSVLNNLAPWTCHGMAVDADGTEYWFLESSFLQGQTLALARLEHGDIFHDRYKVLVTTNGDSPRSYLLVVRPAKTEEGYGQVLLTDDRMVLGLRYENKLYMAYDLTTKHAFRRKDTHNLSPFLCLGAQTLNPNDLDRIQNEWNANTSNKWTKSHVEEARQHANKEVRLFAKQLQAEP